MHCKYLGGGLSLLLMRFEKNKKLEKTCCFVKKNEKKQNQIDLELFSLKIL